MNIYPGSLFYALPVLVIACLTGGIGILAFHRPKQPGATTLGWLMTALTVWSLFDALEILAPAFPEKFLAAKFSFLGIVLTPSIWLTLALEYTGRADWLTRGRRSVLIGVPLVIFGLGLTNEYHQWVWVEPRLDPLGFPNLVISAFGPALWLFAVFAYSLVIAGIAIYLSAYFRARSPFRKQIGAVVFGSFLPLIGSAISLTAPSLVHGLDLTPFTFAVTSVFLAIGIFRYDLLNLMPIAAALVIENLRDAVIVVDDQMRLVDINAAGRTWLRVGDEAIGADARERFPALGPIWDQWDSGGTHLQLAFEDAGQNRWFDVTVSRLRGASGHVMGRVILARDVTREQSLLTTELRRARQLEILNSITRIALETTDFNETLDALSEHLGRLLDANGAFITLWDETRQQVIPATAYGEFRETYKAMTIEPGETTLTESVLRERRTLAVEDVRNTPYMNPRLADDVPTQSVLALPLIANDRKLGAALISFNQRHSFTPEEITVGEQAAAQLALALNKSQLLDTVSRRFVQLGLLQEVSSQAADSLEEKDILQRAVQAMVDVFGYDEAAISLLVEGKQLELVAIGGRKDMGYARGFRQNVGQGIMGHVADTFEPYFTRDVSHDPHYYHPSGQGTGSAMGVPMLLEGKLIGVVYVQSDLPNSIRREDTQTLETLANHLVMAIQKARLYADAREHLLSMTTLQSVTQIVTSSLELDHIFKTVVHLLKENFGYDYVSIYLLDGDALRLGAQVGYPEDLVIYKIPVTSGITGRTIRTRQVQFIRNVRADPAYLKASYEVESEISVPLLKEETVLGVLNIEATSNRPLDENDVELLAAMASPVALAIDNARLHAKVTALALTDGMTGLLNRRAFDQEFETEVARAGRYGYPLSLIVMDLDSFKQYNDAYGHPAGDERLKVIANLLLANVRYPDNAARYGGEEFALILPHTDKAGAMALAERLRAAAESMAPEEYARGGPISGYTISLGVASFPEDGETSAALLRAADDAELTAKRLGKNRVCTANRRQGTDQETIS